MEDDEEENLKELQETEAEDDSFSTEEETENVQTSTFSDVSSAEEGVLRLIAEGEEISRNMKGTWKFPTVEQGPFLSDTIPIGKTFADESTHWHHVNLMYYTTGMAPAVCRLCFYSENGNLERVKRYLLDGLDPNHQCRGSSPLARAIDRDSLPIARLLLDAGANPDGYGSYAIGYSLRAAIEKRNLDMIALLLERGASLDGDYPPLHAATEGGAALDGDYPPLHAATEARFIPAMKILIDAGANLNEPKLERNSLVHASWSGYVEELTFLLEAGANPRISDKDGSTVLHWACEQGTCGTVQMLLDAGADPNVIQFSDELPPLQCSETGQIWGGHFECYETPLTIAVRQKSPSYIRILLSFGADVCLVPPTFDDALAEDDDDLLSEIKSLLESIPSAVTLRTLCLRVIRTHQVNTTGWPPLLFLYPDEAEEYRGYLERTKKFEK